MEDQILRAKLKESPIVAVAYSSPESDVTVAVGDTVTTEQINLMDEKIRIVMSAYQNANRWFDTIKEDLLINKGAYYFSEYIHNLAHTMPVRFDKFGDILHTQHILVPYPATTENPYDLSDMYKVFAAIFDILDNICSALRGFIDCTKDTVHHGMSCSTEDLLVDLESEYEALHHMQKILSISDCTLKFDDWVRKYMYKNTID